MCGRFFYFMKTSNNELSIYMDIFDKEEVWNIWMDSNKFQHEVEIIVIEIKYLWLDHGGNIWITSFSEHLRELWSCSTTHVSWSIIVMMKYPKDVSKPCWINDEIKYWCHYIFVDYALVTTAFTLNRASSWSDEMTSYKLWHGYKP